MSAAPVAIEPTARGRLAAWLAARLGWSGALGLERAGGGQSNPTFFLTVGQARAVLRMAPVGVGAKSGHDIAREYGALAAIHPTRVPVPRPIALEEDPAVLGAPFLVMERADGRALDDARLPSFTPAARRAVYADMAGTLGALHALDPAAVGLAPLARPGFLARQVARWARAWGSDVAAAPVAAWLDGNRPPEQPPRVVHGDFKLNNLILAADAPTIAAVLDWELFTVGDAAADLAYTVAATWLTTPAEYGGIMGAAADGIPPLRDFLAWHAAAAPAAVAATRYHLVFALFRLAGLYQGIAVRAAQGTANDPDAARTGRLGQTYLRRAASFIGHAGEPLADAVARA